MRLKRSAIAWCFSYIFCLVSAAQPAAGNPIPDADQFPPDAPAVVAVEPEDHTLYIDEEQVFLLRLLSPATKASVEANAYCDVEQTAGRIPITVLVGQDRQVILDQFELQGDSIAVLRCRDPLPSSASVTLHWGADIATQAGVTLKSEQTMHFTVRGPFKARVQCKSAFPAGGCSPGDPIEVSFTAAIDLTRAASVRLIDGGGSTFESRDSIVPVKSTREIIFVPPFPPAATLTVTLPRDLTDEAGRTLQNIGDFPKGLRTGVAPVFSGSIMVLEARRGGLLPMNLQHLGSPPIAADAAPKLRLLPIETDPANVASWLRRVLDQGSRSGTCELRPTADLNVIPEELGALVGERCDGGRVWINATQTASVFRNSDSPQEFALPRPAASNHDGKIQFALRQPGLYVAEVAGSLPGVPVLETPKTRHMSTLAVVTNMAVHVMWWPAGALIWVTRLSDGKPIPGADITIVDYCKGGKLWEGRTGPQGIAMSRYVFGPPPQQSTCESGGRPFLVSARSDRDFAFTLSGWKVERGLGIPGVLSSTYSFGGIPLPEGTKRRLRLPTLGAEPTMETAVAKPPRSGYSRATPSPLQLGVRQENSSEAGKIRIRVVAMTAEGKFEPHQSVIASLYAFSVWIGPVPRTKGGFYLNEDVWDTRKLSTYHGMTDNRGSLVVDFPMTADIPRGPRAVRVETPPDAHGHIEGTSMYVVDFDAQPSLSNFNIESAAMNVLAERPEYAPGEVIRLQARIPFPTATALVVIEQNGILTSFVTHLRGKTPMVEVPVLPSYAPAVAISVFAISPMPAPPQPAIGWWNRAHHRLGSVCIKVGSEAPSDSQSDNTRVTDSRPHYDQPAFVDCAAGPTAEVATMLASFIDTASSGHH
jgi:hypothetical protein